MTVTLLYLDTKAFRNYRRNASFTREVRYVGDDPAAPWFLVTDRDRNRWETAKRRADIEDFLPNVDIPVTAMTKWHDPACAWPVVKMPMDLLPIEDWL